MFKSRDEVWKDTKMVALAQNALNTWYEKMLRGSSTSGSSSSSSSSSTTMVEKEEIVCYWVAIGPDGKLHEFETTNSPTHEEYEIAVAHHKAAAGKNARKTTVCAEDVMFAQHPGWAKWTLYSATFNRFHNRSWPACHEQNGGCRRRLQEAGIEEPYRNGSKGRE
jgi:hypothetical protein